MVGLDHPRNDIQVHILNRHGKPTGASSTFRRVVADLGAQVCLMPLEAVLRAFPGLKPTPTTQRCSTANSTPVRIVGKLKAEVRCRDTKGGMAAAVVTFFVAEGINESFLSLPARP